jgi:hypothetical protein
MNPRIQQRVANHVYSTITQGVEGRALVQCSPRDNQEPHFRLYMVFLRCSRLRREADQDLVSTGVYLPHQRDLMVPLSNVGRLYA